MNPSMTLPRTNFFEFAFPDVSLLTKGFLVLACSGLMALSSRLALPLPFTPVPVTAQTFAVLLLAGLLGMRMAISVQLLYLAQGSAGLPVFAPGSTWGIARLLGPTGGFLVGFVAAAAVVGWMADRGYGKRLRSALVMMALGSVAIFAVGVPWLKWVMQVDWLQAFKLGFWPFLMGDVYKIVLATLLLPGTWRLFEKVNPRAT
jgi:biotin transport system substrate-specific component